MAELLQNELKVIKAHSVKTGLETFHMTFILRYLKSENANVTEVVDQLTFKVSDRCEWTIYAFTRLLIEDRREECHTWSYSDTSGSASCLNHSLTKWEWTSQQRHCILLHSPLRKSRTCHTCHDAFKACDHSEWRCCFSNQQYRHLSSCLEPHCAHKTNTTTNNPSHILPIIYIVISADIMVLQHRRLWRHLQTQKADQWYTETRTSFEPLNQCFRLHQCSLQTYPTTWWTDRGCFWFVSERRCTAIQKRQ